MENKCSVCGKKYKTDKTVSYLCPECKEKAKQLPENDESKLMLLSKCEDLGIISIIE